MAYAFNESEWLKNLRVKSQDKRNYTFTSSDLLLTRALKSRVS